MGNENKTTRKAIGFKSLRLNCSDVTQVIQKCEMSTTFSKILNILYYSVVFIEKINLLHLKSISEVGEVFYEKSCS